MRRKILSVIFALGMVVSMLPTAAAEPKVDTDGAYLISTLSELEWFRDQVNSGNAGISGRLTADLDMTGTYGKNLRAWTPIGAGTWGYSEPDSPEYPGFGMGYGFQGNPFTGVFDGGGHTITGLYLDGSGGGCTGLFGYNSGTIRNLGVDGVITGTDDSYVGSVVGYSSDGTVTDCYSTGRVSVTVENPRGEIYIGGVVGYNSNGTVTGCYNTGDVSVDASAAAVTPNVHIGGVVGQTIKNTVANWNTMTNCYNTGHVSADISGSAHDVYVGGLAGQILIDEVTGCYNTGGVSVDVSLENAFAFIYIGGLAGRSTSRMTTCYNTGDISGTGNELSGSAGFYVGGLVGRFWRNTISNCYNTGDVSVAIEALSSDFNSYGFYVGGVVGHNEQDNTTVANCYNVGKVSVKGENLNDTAVGGVVGHNNSGGTVTGSYYLTDTAGRGIGDNLDGSTTLPEAKSAEEFTGLADMLGEGWTTRLGRPMLTDNMEIKGGGATSANPYIISTLAHLETLRDYVNAGNDCTGEHFLLTADLDLSAKYGQGTQSWTPVGASDDSPFQGAFDGGGHTVIGLYIDGSDSGYAGLFGFSSGAIRNLGVDGAARGHRAAGGVVGWNDGGTVQNCYNLGAVTGDGGSAYAGGVAGYNSGTVQNCYNTGAVTGGAYTGGITGYDSGTVQNCYYLIDCVKSGTPTDTAGADGKDEQAFSSGEAAWLLRTGAAAGSGGDAWGQQLTNSREDKKDPSPVLDTEKTVYKAILHGYYETLPSDKSVYFNNVLEPESPPNRDTETFRGWYTDTSYKSQYTPGTVSADPFELYAKWERKPITLSYTVKFLHGEGSGRMDDETAYRTKPDADTQFSVPVCAFTAPKGKVFDHWTLTSPTGQGIILNGSILTIPKEVADGAVITLTAIWKAIGPDDIAAPSAGDTATIPAPTGEISAAATTTGTTASAEVSAADLDHAIASAVDSAARQGDAPMVRIRIEVTAPDPVDSLNVSLPVSSLKNLVGTDNLTLVIISEVAEVSLDHTALTALANQATGSTVILEVTPVAKSELTETQRESTGSAPVMDLSMVCNGIVIHNYNNGRIVVVLPYELKAGQSAGDVVVYYMDESGFLTPCDTSYRSGKVTFTTTHLSKYVIGDKALASQEPKTIRFADVAAAAYYADAVAWAVENGIAYGITDTAFGPEAACTRAQIVSFLWRQAGSPTMDGTNPFTDVSASNYYYDAVLWAAANGIAYGVTDTTFGPDATCTRAQAMSFLYRAKSSPAVSGTNRFTDVSAGDYFADAVQWAAANGIAYGVADMTFGPNQDCTRAQIISFLHRAR